jgi:hypothetical protein
MEDPNKEWIQSWFTEFNKLIKEDEENWIERIKEWEIANPAPQPKGVGIIIPKMGTQQKAKYLLYKYK